LNDKKHVAEGTECLLTTRLLKKSERDKRKRR